jgi:hypothetical protein
MNLPMKTLENKTNKRGAKNVWQDKKDYQQDLQILVSELDGISNDITKYVNFLVERQNLMQQILTDGVESSN